MRKPEKLQKIVNEIKDNSNSLKKNVAALARYCAYDKRKRLTYQGYLENIISLS
jgi:hypothetical protein